MTKNKIFLAALAVITLFFGATFATAKAKKQQKSASLKIVTTIFPEYDWVREILGENSADAHITLLLDNGVDLHSYQPTVQDIAQISDCDVFVYVGGESDKWVSDALKNARNKNMRVVNLLEALGDKVREEEIVEGMQAEEEEESEDGEEEAEYDEHVWLSLRNAQILVKEIAAQIAKADSAHARIYTANAEAYCKRLDALDKKYSAMVNNAHTKTVLFGDRFPFRYLADDYGLRYFAAFVGCSAETEASFETIAFLAKKLNELGLSAVCQIESGNGRIAKTIIQTAKAKNVNIITLDSLQSTTSRDIKKGTTYEGAMSKNLDALAAALN